MTFPLDDMAVLTESRLVWSTSVFTSHNLCNVDSLLVNEPLCVSVTGLFPPFPLLPHLSLISLALPPIQPPTRFSRCLGAPSPPGTFSRLTRERTFTCFDSTLCPNSQPPPLPSCVMASWPWLSGGSWIIYRHRVRRAQRNHAASVFITNPDEQVVLLFGLSYVLYFEDMVPRRITYDPPMELQPVVPYILRTTQRCTSAMAMVDSGL